MNEGLICWPRQGRRRQRTMQRRHALPTTHPTPCAPSHLWPPEAAVLPSGPSPPAPPCSWAVPRCCSTPWCSPGCQGALTFACMCSEGSSCRCATGAAASARAGRHSAQGASPGDPTHACLVPIGRLLSRLLSHLSFPGKLRAMRPSTSSGSSRRCRRAGPACSAILRCLCGVWQSAVEPQAMFD